MNNQTESYIVLKPIAERFSKVANELTDGDIRSIIMAEMRDQLKTIDFRRSVESILITWADENEEAIREMALTSLLNKLR